MEYLYKEKRKSIIKKKERQKKGKMRWARFSGLRFGFIEVFITIFLHKCLKRLTENIKVLLFKLYTLESKK